MKTFRKVLAIQGGFMLALSILAAFSKGELIKKQEALVFGLLGLFSLQLAGLIEPREKTKELELELED